MKKLLLVLLLLVIIIPASNSFALGDKSDGYRMGMLIKISPSGLIFKNGEGYLMLGKDSTNYEKIIKDSKGNTSKIIINPWYFSAELNQIPQISKFLGEMVWIRYKEEILNISSKNTPYRLLDINPLNTDPIEPIMETSIEHNLSKTDDGVRLGRIVKASQKGIMFDTFELLIQMGTNGNQFKHMSIDDPKLFEYAVKCLKGGYLVKITYQDLGFFGKFSIENTNYRITKIEIKN